MHLAKQPKFRLKNKTGIPPETGIETKLTLHLGKHGNNRGPIQNSMFVVNHKDGGRIVASLNCINSAADIILVTHVDFPVCKSKLFIFGN